MSFLPLQITAFGFMFEKVVGVHDKSYWTRCLVRTPLCESCMGDTCCANMKPFWATLVLALPLPASLAITSANMSANFYAVAASVGLEGS